MAQTEPKKDSKQVVVELTMPLEEARRFVWQGKLAPHEAMGKLMDARQLNHRDLGWALDNAFDPRFYEAARTLLAHSIGQPASLRFGAEVVEGSHYLEEKEDESLGTIVALAGYGMGVAVMMLIWSVRQLISGVGILGVVFELLLLVAVAFLLWKFYVVRQIENYRGFRIGQVGEERIVEILRASLDSRWTIFRNLHIPGHKDDIDIVLVSQAGMWVVEVKSLRDPIRVRVDNWEVRTKKGWASLRSNPYAQAKKNAAMLRDFLQKQGINVRWVEPVVALGEDQPVENFQSVESTVWLPSTMSKQVTNIRLDNPPHAEEIQRILEKLKIRAKEGIAAEEARYK